MEREPVRVRRRLLRTDAESTGATGAIGETTGGSPRAAPPGGPDGGAGRVDGIPIPGGRSPSTGGPATPPPAHGGETGAFGAVGIAALGLVGAPASVVGSPVLAAGGLGSGSGLLDAVGIAAIGFMILLVGAMVAITIYSIRSDSHSPAPLRED